MQRTKAGVQHDLQSEHEQSNWGHPNLYVPPEFGKKYTRYLAL
jgi:hypothetical protein